MEKQEIRKQFLKDPDEETYMKRVIRVFHMLDVRTAFTTEQQLQEALQIVQEKDQGVKVDMEQYSRSLKIKNAIVHPDTNEKVTLPLRVSMIVPMNMLLDCGMVLANSTQSTVFWQWLNQTYNALHYYANRNASNEDTLNQRIVAYVGATASSVGASLWIRSLARRASSKHKWGSIIALFAPFAAVASADILNIATMRQSEFLQGVNIYNENGDLVGKSQRAGFLAVASCTVGRIAAAMPILIAPPLIMHRIKNQSFFIKRPWAKIPCTLVMVGLAIQFSVPVTFGLFRQTAQIDVKYLEEEFRNCINKNNQVMTIATYNKGI